MPEGKVKWYDKKKGYGFILSDSGDDVFVHYTDFSGPRLQTLSDGEEVTFEITAGEKGFRAQNVALKPKSPANSST